MPKVVIDDVRGLVQETGTGLTVKSEGLSGICVTSPTTSVVATGAANKDIELVVPAGAELYNVGIVVTTAININVATAVTVSVGTAAGGTQVCGGADIIDGGSTDAAVGSAVSIYHKSVGNSILAFVADFPVHSAAARTLHFRVAHAGNNITTGAVKAFALYHVSK